MTEQALVYLNNKPVLVTLRSLYENPNVAVEDYPGVMLVGERGIYYGSMLTVDGNYSKWRLRPDGKLWDVSALYVQLGIRGWFTVESMYSGDEPEYSMEEI